MGEWTSTSAHGPGTNLSLAVCLLQRIGLRAVARAAAAAGPEMPASMPQIDPRPRLSRRSSTYSERCFCSTAATWSHARGRGAERTRWVKQPRGLGSASNRYAGGVHARDVTSARAQQQPRARARPIERCWPASRTAPFHTVGASPPAAATCRRMPRALPDNIGPRWLTCASENS